MNILLSGGYGYGNVGDEGQLQGILLELRKHFNSPKIKVLTPNPTYTQEVHGEEAIMASRECVFLQTLLPQLYNIRLVRKGSIVKVVGNFFLKLLFYTLMLYFLINVILYKYFKFVFASKNVKHLIQSICEADLLFIVGGGYLTESTLSRLLDTSMIVFAARIFGVKCVMSGQTIGHISHRVNKYILGKALASCELVATRDPLDSIQSAQDLLKREKPTELMFTSDDALILTTSQLNGNYQGYIGIQLHFWGADNEDLILNFYVDIVDYIVKNVSDKIIIFPMHSTDIEAAEKLRALRPQLEIFHYDFEVEEIVKFIHSLRFVISMKHHPLVFSFGGCVPVISINHSEYYRHKNEGAMRNFNFENYSFMCDYSKLGKVKDAIHQLVSQETELKGLIEKRLEEAKDRREVFWKKVRSVI